MWKISLGVVGVFLAMLPSAASAMDPRCEAPPYGGSVTKFRAFASSFGTLVPSARMLSGICNAKFGGDRTALYNFGLTDADIDSQDTADLAVEAIDAMRNIAKRAD